MGNKAYLLTILIVVTLITYLFVSAPPQLSEERPLGIMVSIERVFKMAERENDVVRNLWTKEIVGAGKKIGLEFDDDWQEQGVEAGPLPALFLRETAKSLENNPIRLSLYLGSDYPIKAANRFVGIQKEKFAVLKANRIPQFYLSEDTGLYIGSFPDIAIAPSCVDCHNTHEQSSKDDWKLNDVMGATTWSYPSDQVTVDQAIEILVALRNGFKDAYAAYLKKTASFSKPPHIGGKWPRDGYYLPSLETFIQEVIDRASVHTLGAIMELASPTTPTQVTSYSQKQIREATGLQNWPLSS